MQALPLSAAPAVAAAPELVEVWRPGGRSDERRPRHDRNRHRHQNKPAEGAQPVAAEGEAGEGAKRERHGRPNERHGASATRIFENRAAMRRLRPRALSLPPKARRRFASRARTKAAPPASVSRAKIEASPATAATRANSPASRKAIVTAAAPVAARRTGNMRPARRRANASARSIPIRLSPNWRRSRSSSRRRARISGLSLPSPCPPGEGTEGPSSLLRCLLGAPASRQMVVACAGRQSPHQRRCADRGRPCPRQWRAGEGARPFGEGRRRRHRRPRSHRADSESGRICRAARRRIGRARAV